MIICSCNYITKSDIEQVVTGLLDEDCWQLITPGVVYHALRKQGKCCGCFPGAVELIVATCQAYHRTRKTPEAEIIPFINRIVEEDRRCATVRELARLAKQHTAA